MQTASSLAPPTRGPFQLKHLPEVNFSHIRNMTDDTGIIQHAIFNIPNRKEGYCIDDNARALLLCVLAGENKKKKKGAALLLVDFLFFLYIQKTDIGFKNFF